MRHHPIVTTMVFVVISIAMGSHVRSEDYHVHSTSHGDTDGGEIGRSDVGRNDLVLENLQSADTSLSNAIYHDTYSNNSPIGSPIGETSLHGNVIPASKSVPLSPPRPTRSRISDPAKFFAQDKTFRQVASSLSVVIGIFLLFVVFNRSVSRRKSAPHEMIEVLGRTAVTPKHNLHLIRVRDRLILLAETPQGLQQLETMPSPNVESDDTATKGSKTEKATPIHDPEAQRLLDMIRRNDGWSSADPPIGRLRDTTYVG